MRMVNSLIEGDDTMNIEKMLKPENRLCSSNSKSKDCRGRLRMRCRQMLLISLIAHATAYFSLAAGQDWPQWRGLNRDGVAEAVALPGQLPENLQPIWKIEVGEGHSAPVVAGRKVALLVRQGEKEVVLCLDTENGQEIWRYSYTAPYTPRVLTLVLTAKAPNRPPPSQETKCTPLV